MALQIKMSNIPLTINYKNFHTVVNEAFEKGLEENGLDPKQFRDESETLDAIVSYWQGEIPWDSQREHGSLFARTMKVFADISDSLDTNPPRTDKTDSVSSFKQICDDIEGFLSSTLQGNVLQFATDCELYKRELIRSITTLESLGKSASLISEANGMTRLVTSVLKMHTMLTGGITNAFKTYFGLAKLAAQKLTERGTPFNADDLKSLIANNKALLKRLASLAMPMLMLFDNMNEVKMDSTGPYNYNADNFEIVDGASIAPKQKFLEDFANKASKPRETIISKIINYAEKLETSTILGYMEKPGHKVKIQGCISFKDGLMDRFFDQMDAMICKVVDVHFA